MYIMLLKAYCYSLSAVTLVHLTDRWSTFYEHKEELFD